MGHIPLRVRKEKAKLEQARELFEHAVEIKWYAPIMSSDQVYSGKYLWWGVELSL